MKTMHKYFQGTMIFVVALFLMTACKVKQNTVVVPAINYKGISVYEFKSKSKGNCGKILDCEGKETTVFGKIDYQNVYHNQQFSIDKFFFKDVEGTYFVEVKVETENNKAIFDKILAADTSKVWILEGVAKGFDAPTNGYCRRSCVLILNSKEKLYLN
jgi:hypothetical protein